LLLLVLGVTGVTGAHPNESSAYGMRSLVRLSEKGLHAMVILEVPIGAGLEEFRNRYIIPGLVDPNNIGQEQLNAYNQFQWARLASGLRIEINDEVREGSWQPVDTPINGKASEGFFVYLLWYKLQDPKAELGSVVTVEIENQSFQGVPMYLSGYADCRGGWGIRENSAKDLLGDGALIEKANQNPASWTENEAMRKLRVVYALSD
jgi:hypothetical protein